MRATATANAGLSSRARATAAMGTATTVLGSQASTVPMWALPSTAAAQQNAVTGRVWFRMTPLPSSVTKLRVRQPSISMYTLVGIWPSRKSTSCASSERTRQLCAMRSREPSSSAENGATPASASVTRDDALFGECSIPPPYAAPPTIWTEPARPLVTWTSSSVPMMIPSSPGWRSTNSSAP